MKKITIILSFCMLFITASKGQDIYNGRFEITDPNFPPYTTPSPSLCPVFDNGFIPNWYRSHGTPDYHYKYSIVPNKNNCGIIRLQHDQGVGEGIVGGYAFKKGLTYNIELGIYSVVNAPLQLEVAATNNLLEGDACYLSGNACQCLAPVPTNNPNGTTFQKENIWNSGTINVSVSNPQIFSFSYTPSGNYDQIWIYTKYAGQGISMCYLDYVKIWTCTNGSILFDDNSTPANQVPAGITAKRYIQAIGYNNITVNDPFNPTQLIGTGITLNEKFEANIYNDNAYFLAVAVPDCIQPVEYETFICEEIIASKMSPAKDEQEELTTGKISIYPNPVTDFVNVQYFCKDDNHMAITIKNMNGQTLYKETGTLNKGSHLQRRIDIQNYPSGVYFIEVTFNDKHEVQKLIKQ